MTCAILSPHDIREQCEKDMLDGPPGLDVAAMCDDWDDDGSETPDDDVVMPPPGLGGDISGEATMSWSPWLSSGPPGYLGHGLDTGSLQATSLPGQDWKSLFPPGFTTFQDPWKSEEPALVHLSDASTDPDDERRERNSSGSDDDPTYVESGPEPVHFASENEMLNAENARLAMENEMLKSAWASSDMSAGYWSPDGSSATMDMAWAGMSPFFANQWAWTEAQMWEWNAAAMSSQKDSRARTDSDVALRKARKQSGSREMDRPRTVSDINDMHTLGENYAGAYLTVMLRNLPNNYTRAMLLKLIDAEGFAGQYDFVYLPMDFKSHASLGYAFVNLVNSETAMRFFETFVGFNQWVVPSQKVCSVNWSAPYQGLDAHLERYRNSPVMHEDVPDDYKPMVFCSGKRITFPPPTKKLKVPRMRVGNEKTEGGSAED